MSFVNIKFIGEKDKPTEDVRLERLLSTFNKMETDKLVWFSNYVRHSNLFIIGDPVFIHKERIREIVDEEMSLRRYTVCRESLEELKRNIIKILKKKLDCESRIWIPILDTDDPEKWEKACRTRCIGSMRILTEKEFEGIGTVRVNYGEI